MNNISINQIFKAQRSKRKQYRGRDKEGIDRGI